MCGIAGIVSRNISLVSEHQLRAGTGCLRHRGPESEGLWINEEGTAALGHRRLSIIDLSPEAAQPMQYGSYTIIHNGELYNFPELRKDLEKKGHSFRTHSDTEVIAAAFAAWGPDCLSRFDGMFAFAIWDEKNKELFAARDRFGEKPFFFSLENEVFLFASQLQALWQMGVTREVNPSLLYNFLTIGYTTNPNNPQESFFSGISKLPAASFLRYSSENGELTIEKYWQPPLGAIVDMGPEEAIDAFRDIFYRSVERRLRSDVPVGTSLSGGLDSSAIVAACAQRAGSNYSHKCFTAVFEGFEKNESSFASTVAGHFGLEHFTTTITADEVPTLMEKVMHFQEEPFTSASVLAQYKVYGLAKEQGVTVLLDGQGADELLAGYGKYFRWYWQELYRARSLNSSGELKLARKNGITAPFGLVHRLAALLPEFASAMQQSQKAGKAFHHPGLDRDFASGNRQSFAYTLPSSPDLNAALYNDCFVHGLEELLRLADRNSMAHAVEVRLPFLDHLLAEFLFSIPAHYKIRDGWTKWLLRKSMENELLPAITWRKDKTGFEPPQKQWMQQPKVQAAIMEGKKLLVEKHILQPAVLKKIQPHHAYAADPLDWKYWSASFLFR